MATRRSEKCMAMLIDIIFLTPFSYFIGESFYEKSASPANEIFFSHPSLPPVIAACLSLFFAVSGYFLFFHYIIKQTPGHSLLRRKHFPVRFPFFQIPKSLALASATLLIIFSSLLYTSRNTSETSPLARCSIIDESLASWSKDGIKSPSRIEASLTLFQAELIPKSCLKAESLRAVRQQKRLTEAYLGLIWANNFENIADQQVARSRLTETCSIPEKNEACKIVESSEPNRAIASIEEKQNQADYVKIYQLKQLEKNQHYEEALSFLNRSHFPTILNPFVAQKRFELLWRLGQKEAARSSYRNAFDFLNLKDRLKVAQSMCQMELGISCEDKMAKACQDYVSAFKSEGRPEEFRSSYERTLRCISTQI